MHHTSWLKTCLCAGLVLASANGAVYAEENVIGTIESVEGTAMISDGARYVLAEPGMLVRQNDRILVMDGSRARLQYNDGCNYQMSESELLTIGDTSMCAKQKLQTADNTPQTQAEFRQTQYEGIGIAAQSGINSGTMGAGKGAAVAGTTGTGMAGSSSFLVPTVGIVTAGAIGGVAALSNDDDRKSPSQ